MAQRSVLKSADYWKHQIAYLTKSVRTYQAMAKDNADDDELRERAKRMVWSRLLNLLRAHYSAGSPIEKLPPIYKELTTQLAVYLRDPAQLEFKLSDIDDYVNVISMLSLGLLLRAGEKELAPVLELAGAPGQDRLIDRIAGRNGKARTTGEGLAHAKPFGLLEEALLAESSDDAANDLIEFLQKYYAGIRRTYFYNTHLKEDAGFVGYWSFEAGLVAVIKDIDDSGITDNPYYPADLVAYARRPRPGRRARSNR